MIGSEGHRTQDRRDRAEALLPAKPGRLRQSAAGGYAETALAGIRTGRTRLRRGGPILLPLYRSDSRLMGLAGRPSGLVAQALRDVGQGRVTPQHI